MAHANMTHISNNANYRDNYQHYKYYKPYLKHSDQNNQGPRLQGFNHQNHPTNFYLNSGKQY